MIIANDDGRHKSVKTLDERRSAIRELWSNMSSEERKVAMSIFDEFDQLSEQGESSGFDSVDEVAGLTPLYQQLSSAHYEGQVASASEFYFGNEYLGRAGSSLFPTWRKDLIDLDRHQYNEVIITGSIGGGKTVYCNFGLVREFYLLCMLKDPQKTFGLMPDTELVFVCFNRDKKLARDVTFKGVKSLIETSPFFQKLPLKIGRSELEHKTKNIRIISASVRSSDALGRNIFGGLIDETDFLQGSALMGDGLSIPGQKSFAERLHESILSRMKSRYVRLGAVPGKLFMSSSARHKSSFTNKRISACKNMASVFVRDYALYEAQPAERFKSTRFHVLVGNERIKHRILKDEEYDAYSEEDIIDLKEKGCRFLHVPDDFRSDFESNIEKSVQDIGGVVTPSMSRYIQLSERIHHAIDPTLFHPLETLSWKTDERPKVKWDKLVRRKRIRLGVGRYEEVIEPIRHPNAPRHVHIDLSRGATDQAGLCIAHTVDVIDVERRTQIGQSFKETVPVIEVDLMLQIFPPRDGEIDFGAIRGLVYDFMEHGYSITHASLDSWQSSDSIQQFRRQGLKAEIVSTWKTTEPYDVLKTCIYEGRISYYNYPVIIEELEQLEKNEVNQKIDHPVGGSKDVADALAGVAYTLSAGSLGGKASIGLGISNYEGERNEDSEWIRKTMEHSGDSAPIAVEGSNSGPIITVG